MLSPSDRGTILNINSDSLVETDNHTRSYGLEQEQESMEHEEHSQTLWEEDSSDESSGLGDHPLRRNDDLDDDDDDEDDIDEEDDDDDLESEDFDEEDHDDDDNDDNDGDGHDGGNRDILAGAEVC